MDTTIRMPFLERRRDNLHIQKGVLPDDGDNNPFLGHSFVKISSGLLKPVLTADVLCYGWCPEPSHKSTEQPPSTLYGQQHWPFDPTGCRFIMNITDSSGHIGQAAGAPQLSGAVIGTSYGLYRTAGGIQMLDVANTTQLFAKVVAHYPNQAETDYNGLVLVELLAAVIQA